MSRRGGLYLLGGIVLVIAAALGGAAVIRFLKYSNGGLDGLQSAPQPVVSITSPPAYSQASLDAPLTVEVAANGYQPLVSTELWVSGKLMGVQAATTGGQLIFNSTFLWSPGAAGEFSLVARTLDTQGSTAVSPAVLVNILPHVPGPGESSSFDAGPAMVSPGAPGGGAAGPVDGGLPGPDANVGSAHKGAPSPGSWLNDMINKQPPAAPGLAVAVKGCTATLSIHDLSNNEDGFQVFRSTDYSPGWTQIATLSSQSALDWMTYPDTLKGASQALYYVAAVNGIGQAKSNLASASFAPADCPAAESSQQVLSVEPLSFTTDLPVDQAYCYKSTNNAQWDRWPQVGFFEPGADGFDIQKYKLAFAVDGLDGKPILKTLDLHLECWGWAAGALQYLGAAHFTNDLSNLREQDEQRGANFTLGLGFIKGNPNKNKPPVPAFQDTFPYIYAVLTYDPNLCKIHLSPDLDPKFINCSPFPPYTLGPGTAHPQPYLIWGVSATTCPAGQNAACHFVPALESIAQANNAELFFFVEGQGPGGPTAYSAPGGMSAYVVPPHSCVGQRQYYVVLDYHVDGTPDSDDLWGPTSNVVNVPCYPAILKIQP